MSTRGSILVLGPTAAGKSSLALEIATRMTPIGECVSADSMQVYRGMDIGTAKLPLRERRGIPHHLLDIIEPSDDTFSVDRWLTLCEDTCAAIRARSSTPIIVGGTNLYVQALLRGLSDALPPPSEPLRSRLNELPLDELRAQLEEVDPVAAQRIHLNDRKRTVRALEVYQQTGSRLSELQMQWDDPRAIPNTDSNGEIQHTAPILVIGLDMPVEAINRRINARVKLMLDQGLLDEVRRLHACGLGRNAREALGYKQIIDHLEGRSTLDEAIEQIKIRTRRYAKQQRTWLRRFRTYRPAVWLNAEDRSSAQLADELMPAIVDFLASGSAANP